MAFDDGLVLDLALFELRRHGRGVPMEPQTFDVLTYLVSHRDRVVPKQELMDAVWGGRFVTEAAVTSRIKQARKALEALGAKVGDSVSKKTTGVIAGEGPGSKLAKAWQPTSIETCGRPTSCATSFIAENTGRSGQPMQKVGGRAGNAPNRLPAVSFVFLIPFNQSEPREVFR